SHTSAAWSATAPATARSGTRKSASSLTLLYIATGAARARLSVWWRAACSMTNRFGMAATRPPSHSPPSRTRARCSSRTTPVVTRHQKEGPNEAACVTHPSRVGGSAAREGAAPGLNSIRVLVREDTKERDQDDLDVERQAPVFDVVEVVDQTLFDGGLAAQVV